MTQPLWDQPRPVDDRWGSALLGLRCLAFPKHGAPWELAEITGIDGFYVFVVIDGEDEPRRLFWCDVRPLAPADPLRHREDTAE